MGILTHMEWFSKDEIPEAWKWGFSKIRSLFGGPHSKDYSILASILGSPVLRNYQIQIPS